VRSLSVLLILTLSLAWAGPPASPAWTFFQKVLDEAGMTYRLPPGYRERPPEPNDVLVYHYRVANPETGVEIRYLVIPIDRIKVDYDDPHASAPEPDHLFSLLFPSVLTQVAVDGGYREKEYPGLEALRIFGADWAAAGVLTPNPKFAPFAHCMVIAMHKNGRADAFEFFLADDLAALKKAVLAHQGALRYRSEEGP